MISRRSVADPRRRIDANIRPLDDCFRRVSAKDRRQPLHGRRPVFDMRRRIPCVPIECEFGGKNSAALHPDERSIIWKAQTAVDGISTNTETKKPE